MKRIIIIVTSLLLAISNYTFAQNLTDSTDAYLLDFSVPDMPAFKALGTDPSNVLRPSDIQKFAAMVSPFYSDGKGGIPKNFALEVAPWKLGSKNMRLTDPHRINRVLYNTGFSLATVRDSSTNASKMSLGLRMNLIPEKHDILLVAASIIQDTLILYIRYKTELENAFNNSTMDRTKYPRTIDNENGFNQFIRDINAGVKFNDTVTAAWNKLTDIIGNNIPDSLANTTGLPIIFYKVGVTSILNRLIKEWRKNGWNRNRQDIAAAFVGQSPDTLLKTSQFSSFHFWYTGAYRLGKSGQLLLGANMVVPRSETDTFKTNFAINARGYLGTQDFRGFFEVQYKYKNYDNPDLKNALLLNLGAEFRFMQSFWIVANAGINNYFIKDQNPLSLLVSSIDIRYAFNKPGKR